MIRWPRSLQAAALIFTLAALAFAVVLARALVIVPVVTAPAAAPDETNQKSAAAEQAVRARSLARADLMLAVDHDPFQPDRRRPPERYRMPGEEVLEEEPAPPPPPPPPFRVLGTVVAGDGGVAVIETQNVARVVGVGESVFGYRLAAVNPATATVESSDGRSYSLQIEPPPPTRATRTTAGRAGRGTQNQAEAARAEAARERALEALERARGRGNSPQMNEMVQEILRRNFPNAAGIGNIEVTRSPDGQQQIIIRPRPDTLPQPRP